MVTRSAPKPCMKPGNVSRAFYPEGGTSYDPVSPWVPPVALWPIATRPFTFPSSPWPPHQVMPNYIAQTPSLEANSFSASQETFRILWKQEIHHDLEKCSPLVPVKSQDDEIYAFPTLFFIMHFNIIPPCTPWSSKIPVCYTFHHQNPCTDISSSPNVPHARPYNSPWFSHPNNGWRGAQTMHLSLLCFIHPLLPFSTLRPNIFISTRFSKTLSLC